jgi:hypothetical protein
MKNDTSVMIYLLMEILLVLLMIYTTTPLYKIILIILLGLFEILLVFNLVQRGRWKSQDMFLFIGFLLTALFILSYVSYNDFYFISLIGLGIMSVNFLGIILQLLPDKVDASAKILPVEEVMTHEEAAEPKENIFDKIETYDIAELRKAEEKEEMATELKQETKALEKAQKEIDELLVDAKKKVVRRINRKRKR